MKSVLIHLLLAGAPPFLSWHLAGVIFAAGTLAGPLASAAVQDEPSPQQIEVVVTATAEDGTTPTGSDEPDARQIVVTAYKDDGNAPVVLVKTDGKTTKADGQSKVTRIRVEGKDSADAEPRGWLGVSIDEVPEALSAQLKLEGRGVLISNVMTGSPADKAGFQANDVILSINGEAVDGVMSHAVDLIKSRKPSETVSFVVIRNGEQTTLNATLGSRADMKTTPGAFSWRVYTAPGGEIKDHIKTRGKFIRRGPGGEWIVKDLGDLKDLADLPENIEGLLPKSGDRSTQVVVEGGAKTIRTKVENDGSALVVEQKDDGPITVHRTDDTGKETVATYDDKDALRSGDEEAFKLFDEVGKSVVIDLESGDGIDGNFDFNFDFDSDAWKDAMWTLNGSLSGAHEAYQKAMEELDQSMEKLNSGAHESYQKAMEELHQSMEKLKSEGFKGGGALPMAMGLAHQGKPRQSFEVRTDGTIEVRVRKGDSELVQLYTNESDLQQRDADLYQKYQELKSIKE
jgi:membrane-associated protease RseP (regulator of RpoE activity)